MFRIVFTSLSAILYWASYLRRRDSSSRTTKTPPLVYFPQLRRGTPFLQRYFCLPCQARRLLQSQLSDEPLFTLAFPTPLLPLTIEGPQMSPLFKLPERITRRNPDSERKLPFFEHLLSRQGGGRGAPLRGCLPPLPSPFTLLNLFYYFSLLFTFYHFSPL